MTRRGWVLITGASRGIGAATAESLARKGFDLVLWARTASALTAEAARAAGAKVVTATVDVADAAQVRAALPAGIDRLAGLVLNAGHGVWRPLGQIDLAEWRGAISVNLDGPFHVLTAVLPLLTARPGGIVVGVLSDSVLYPFPERAAYTAAKAGMSALLEVARRELRPRGVRVSSLLPSRVDTCFRGAHEAASPGDRPGALSAAEVAEVIGGLFELPANVEIRQVQLAAMTTSYGPFPEGMQT
ncbi:SDR family oxidoreductase [Kutzneria buriramensis]|uniref:NADP-dependent 3-hydroxy acid dehydrogenase YdfG n=1 Tax=Kutzneria buriramensis TaxID=1045776 RepID=A0A3E0G683_9PSEU|nr:SDR family oxidoreductase [Kutzneria buriramensis]REH18145.1 NADP-dependent 3-hydroxy acid dehydrogenase YdfG [Kutzneria buriramensis]